MSEIKVPCLTWTYRVEGGEFVFVLPLPPPPVIYFHPSEEDWEAVVTKTWEDARRCRKTGG